MTPSVAPPVPPDSVKVILKTKHQRATLSPVPGWGRIQSVGMPMSETEDVEVVFVTATGEETPVGIFRKGGFESRPAGLPA